MENSKRLETGSLYTVGWIAALSIELTAAIQMLDEQHCPPADYHPRPMDTNVYVWGRVGDHNVIIAFLEAGAYGTVPAATTATNLFGSFPSIKMCLLVGIGAGIRRKGYDVRLGDVVISQPDGKSGGVYQYDLQKAKSEGQLENVGILNRPSTLLLKILTRIQAHHAAHPSKVPEYTKRITREMAPPFNEPGYVHQGLKNDRLFKSTFSHISESAAVDDEDFDFDDSSVGEPSTTCPYCPPEEEVKRRERPSGTNPQFHYGTIASGNTLVKDASTRNKIVTHVPGNCICFEMEAAGTMNSFPCLVIRGICDYADSHKNDRWQLYAALTAAAYAREFLQFAPRGDVETEQPLAEQLEDITRIMHSIQDTTAEVNATLQVGEVEKWLSPFDSSGIYNIAIDKRNEGLSDSGKWLLDSKTFLDWKNTKSSFLWLHGLAGCGKTILCSTAIEDLKSDIDRIVLYFYFAFNHQRTLSKGSLLRSLIMQLSCYDEYAIKQLAERKKEKNNQQPSDKELGKIFMSMAALFKQVTIVLDGVDELECKDDKRRDVLLWIKETVSINTGDIRILVSSRHERDIAMALESIHLTFHLVPGAIEQDIKAFVHKQIHGDFSSLDRWRDRPDVQAMIEDSLTEKSNGMFRWVACQIQAIQNCLDIKSLREQLSSLPKTLEETYDRIIQDLRETRKKDAIKLLQFLAFAERPLELFEAIDLIAVDVTETPSFDPINRMPEPLGVMDVCSSLVVLDLHDPEHKRLQLAHSSVKEYLVSGRMRPDLFEHFKEISAHSSIVNVCLGYLESVLPSVSSIWVNVPDGRMRSASPQEVAAWKHDLSRFPLMDYAIHEWPVHAQRCNQDRGAAMQIQKFFQHESCLIKWLFCFSATRSLPVPVHEGERLEVSCPILLSIYLNLREMALEMIDKGFELEAEVISENVLRWLVPDRHFAARPFFGMAYEVGHRRYRMTSHLYLATYNEMDRVVEALIERGIDIHEEGGEWGTALKIACFQCMEDTIAILLECSRDCASQTRHKKYVQGALELIVTHWDSFEPDEVVPIRDQLIDYCLILDNPRSLLDYCLMTVFFDLNLELAQILVQKGAHVDVIVSRSKKLGNFFADEEFLLSFLHLFSGEEHGNDDPGALQKLFTAEYSSERYTMIHRAIEQDFNTVLRFMVAHGVRERHVPLDRYQCTALFLAIERDNMVAVQSLLDSKTAHEYGHGRGSYTPSRGYINEKNWIYRETCLHVAAKRNHITVMKVLISADASLEVRNWYLRTALHLACESNCLQAVKLLVECGANLQALDLDERTPLQLARLRHSWNVVQFLEQWNSQNSSDDGSHSEGENVADNDDSFSTERDSKRQKTG